MFWIAIFILGVAGGIILGRIYNKKKQKEFVNKQGELKQENLKKILESIQSQTKITNNDVEKFLNVSDATAERYLNQLEREGKIEQVGETGRSVYYKAK